MNLDSLQQQVALAVAILAMAALAVACQLPFLTLWTPSQSVFHGWREKNEVVAHRPPGANVPKCPWRNAICLSQETVSPTSDTGIAEIVKGMCWNGQRVCRVCASYHKFDGAKLAEHLEKWSKLAKIGSVDILGNRADPRYNR